MRESGEFELLYRTHYASLRRLAAGVTRDADAAHDIVQEVFVRLWHKRNNLAAIKDLRAYLVRAAMNGAISYASRARRTTDPVLLQFTGGGADAMINEKELTLAVDAAIASLPGKCRAVFMLCRFENMSYAQAAASLGISVKTVENQMGHAFRKLRERLKPFLGDMPLPAILALFLLGRLLLTAGC